MVEEDTKVGPRDGVVNVGILKDNVGRLATQLEGNLLEVALGRGLEDGTADSGGTGEGDLVDVHVAGDGRTSDTTETGDDVDHTRGETSLLDELTGVQTGEGGLLSSLEDDGVTGGDGGGDLPSPHEEGEVPGDDLTADTNGFVTGVGEGLGVGVNGLTVDFVGPAGVVTDAAQGVGQVDLGHGEGLAVVEGLNGGQSINVALNQVGQLVQETTTVGRGNPSPFALKGLAGGGHGDVDILLVGLMDGGDDLLVGGVDGLEGLTLGALDVFVVDEPVDKPLLAMDRAPEGRGSSAGRRTGRRAAQL